MQEKKLALHFWRVFTTDEITQRAIAGYIEEHGNGGNEKTEDIYYDGRELHCFVLPFIAVQFLLKNKHTGTYSFTVLHKERKTDQYSKWNEGKKTSGSLRRETFGDEAPKKAKARQLSLFGKK